MSGKFGQNSDFAQTLAVHSALKFALGKNLYARDASTRRAAESLSRELQSDRTIFGRQLKMLALMKKGASLSDLQRKLRSSRRTVFRYLNALEESGISIELIDDQYHVSADVAALA